MPSPPKPWEVNNVNSGTAVTTSPSTAVSLTSITAPDIPTRSTTTTDSLTTPVRPTAQAYSGTGYGSTGYGGYSSTGYGGYGSTGYGGYGSTGYGGYGSTGYGGMSSYNRSYGGGYGGYGSYGGYGGMNRYGGQFGRMNGGPGGPEDMGLTQRMEMGTRPAFEVIENIVGSFGGFAQMLDSTFMATHSSFMAMVGVAEQLGFLKNYLGQVFSIFALYRVVKRAIAKLTGRVPAGKSMEMNVMEFQNFEQKTVPGGGPKMSRKPFVIFMLMVIGLPYMMHKLIQLISSSQKLQQQMNPNAAVAAAAAAIDPAKLEFARAMYDFISESPMELTLKKGDIVAIISKTDPTTNATSQWWRGRLRDGTMGMFPANYVEIIQKNNPPNSSLQEATDALNGKAVAPIVDVTTATQQITTKLV